MEEWITIECPYCGQRFELAVDVSISHQQFVSDCEVCCRPYTVSAECEDGEVVHFEVQGD